MATTVASQSNSMSIVNHTVIRATTDSATAAAATFTIGFVPRVVRVHNVTDRISQEWFEGMAAASALNSAADGVRTLITSNGITVGTDGTVTLPAAIMVASKVFAVECIG
jgi:hypothetical protein